MTCGPEEVPGPFTRCDASQWVVLSVEKSGSTPSTWLQDPHDADVRWLHKDTVIPANGREQGEDWSEAFSTQVALALGVPVAPVQLCVRQGRRGSLSRNIRPPGADLNDGLIALEECSEVVGYFPHREGVLGVDPDRPRVKRPGHTLANLRRALTGVCAPPGFDGPDQMDGFDVFAGYVVLDAVIANRDRHEENWAVLRSQLTGHPDRLAPTYDHASSLGYNLSDGRRQRCLEDPEALTKWVNNGTAYRFEHADNPLTLVELAVSALGSCSEVARAHWVARLAGLDLGGVHDALDTGAVPQMSEVACKFAGAVLDQNLERLRDAIARA